MPFFGTGQPAEKACFSAQGGFYEESFSLEIFPFYQQHHIRFTTNGNRPTAQSQLYTEPLLLDESLSAGSRVEERKERRGKTSVTYKEYYDAGGQLIRKEIACEDSYPSIEGLVYVSSDVYR